MRLGMYKNYSVGKVKYVDSKRTSKMRHVLIGSIELCRSENYAITEKSTELIDEDDQINGIYEASRNHHVFFDDSYDIRRDMVDKWVLYGYYLWSNRDKDKASSYRNLMTMRYFEILDDKEIAKRVALEIMDSIKQIDHLNKQQ